MDLSTMEVAGAVYESYIGNFTNPDGTVNWLPLCGEADGLVANRAVFEEYGIPLPTDYESLVAACQAFDAQLRKPKDDAAETVLTLEQGYSNIFHKKGGNESYSAMANTLRAVYDSDVLIAPSYSFTGSVMKADYTEKMAGNMIIPNPLEAWKREMSGAELKEYIRCSVEGVEDGFTPFNRGSLTTVSGLSIEVLESEDGTYMNPLLSAINLAFEKEEKRVKETWTAYILDGGQVAEPENYITLK